MVLKGFSCLLYLNLFLTMSRLHWGLSCLRLRASFSLRGTAEGELYSTARFRQGLRKDLSSETRPGMAARFSKYTPGGADEQSRERRQIEDPLRRKAPKQAKEVPEKEYLYPESRLFSFFAE
jgi:hypothetical protein